jgi:hypothetical protein
LEAKKMNENKGLPAKFHSLKPKAKRSSSAEGLSPPTAEGPASNL